jgi:hypothetical protein
MASSGLLLDDFVGVSAVTGETIRGEAHLRQSITDILSTPIGSRVMDRDYGSRVPSLLAAPINAATVADLVASTAEAIRRWEPRVVLKRVAIQGAEVGRLSMDLVVIIKGRTVLLEGVI